MEKPTVEKSVHAQVEQILETNSVLKAQAIMRSRKGWYLIALISFIESATPIPVVTDPFMMAAILLNRAAYLKIILITTFASVLGGVVAYYVAYFFIDVLIDIFPPDTSFAIARATANTETSTFLLTLIGAFTPVPYTFTAWAVGALQGGIIPFVAASFIGRGGRYVIGGWLTYRFGPAAVERARKSIGLTSIVLVVLIALFVWYKIS